ncbi:MAG TPA: PHP domain-containing protein [Clostridiaceae bacterium]|nr:PHP domain-containing protein [Clostridiaceae bacterium]
MTGQAKKRLESISFLGQLTRQGGIDLHIHTTASDGSDTPEEIVRLAMINGLRAIAIADHDTIDALPNANTAVQQLKAKYGYDLLLIPATEMAVEFEQNTVHLLAYFPYGGIEGLEPLLARQRATRVERNQKILRQLDKLGFAISEEEVRQQKKDDSASLLGRSHIALAMVQKGYVKTMADAFNKYLKSGRPAFVHRSRDPLDKITAEIHRQGGVAVLAHPQMYNWTGKGKNNQPSSFLLNKLTGAKKMGLDGVECFHGEATTKEQEELLQASLVLNLTPTAGSDYHGTNKTEVKLYTGTSLFY